MWQSLAERHLASERHLALAATCQVGLCHPMLCILRYVICYKVSMVVSRDLTYDRAYTEYGELCNFASWIHKLTSKLLDQSSPNFYPMWRDPIADSSPGHSPPDSYPRTDSHRDTSPSQLCIVQRSRKLCRRSALSTEHVISVSWSTVDWRCPTKSPRYAGLAITSLASCGRWLNHCPKNLPSPGIYTLIYIYICTCIQFLCCGSENLEQPPCFIATAWH